MTTCKKCGSGHIIKAGRHRNKTGLFQVYKCQNCGTTELAEQLE